MDEESIVRLNEICTDLVGDLLIRHGLKYYRRATFSAGEGRDYADSSVCYREVIPL